MTRIRSSSESKPDGRRECKRRRTRERIQSSARRLFLERGFEATTIEDIAEAANVSKRSFFSYFPSKEEVVYAWQDGFGQILAEAVLARPSGETMVQALEEALAALAEASAADIEGVALASLIRETPALAARDHVKYASLEEKLTAALIERKDEGKETRLRAQLVSMVVVGGLRLGWASWAEGPRTDTLAGHLRGIYEEIHAAMGERQRG